MTEKMGGNPTPLMVKGSKAKLIQIDPITHDANCVVSEGCQGASICSCGTDNQCASEPMARYDKGNHWVIGEVETVAGRVPRVSTDRVFRDTLGSWKVRWGINRMNYKIDPGLYAAGEPDHGSPVLVSANYKLSFDALREELKGLNAWILVLDTKGINVWCAAGKGTFGTQELLNRIVQAKVAQVVSHRTLILPQLGAPGVSSHEVTKHSGFKVVYGPVRAKDLKEFLAAGMKATPEMRQVRFNIYDRLVLTPVEWVGTLKLSLVIFGLLFLLNLIGMGPFGVVDFYAYIGAVFVGCVLTPVLLPWIPGRAFAWKGWLLGFLWALSVNVLNGWPQESHYSWLRALAYGLILPSVSAFYAMNFTGASAYTSFSGVLKEMKIALPVIIVTIFTGSVLILVNSFIKF